MCKNSVGYLLKDSRATLHRSCQDAGFIRIHIILYLRQRGQGQTLSGEVESDAEADTVW